MNIWLTCGIESKVEVEHTGNMSSILLLFNSVHGCMVLINPKDKLKLYIERERERERA